MVTEHYTHSLPDRDANLRLRNQLADVWDEGARAATNYGIGKATNPYRNSEPQPCCNHDLRDHADDGYCYRCGDYN